MVSSKDRGPQTQRTQELRARQGKGEVPELAKRDGRGQRRTKSWFTGGLSSTAFSLLFFFFEEGCYEEGKAKSPKNKRSAIIQSPTHSLFHLRAVEQFAKLQKSVLYSNQGHTSMKTRGNGRLPYNSIHKDGSKCTERERLYSSLASRGPIEEGDSPG